MNRICYIICVKINGQIVVWKLKLLCIIWNKNRDKKQVP